MCLLISRAKAHFFKRVHHFVHFIGRELEALFEKCLVNSVERFRHRAGYGRQSVAVAAERDRRSRHVLKVVSFKKCRERLRNSSLTTFVEKIRRADFVACSAQIVAEFFFHIFFDFFLRLSVSQKPNRRRDAFRAHS